MGIARRQMRRRGIMRTAATVSMISSARTNRAQRKAIEAQNDQPQQGEYNEQEPMQSAIDPTAELKKYKDLLDQGIITEGEYNSKKSQLLGL